MTTFQSSCNSKYSDIQELHDIENQLIAYNSSIVKYIIEYSGKCSPVLDFGSGIGTLAAIYRDRTAIKPVCVEIDEELVQILQSRGFRTFRNLEELHEKFSAVYSSNVLEHIEDDITTLKKIRDIMPQGAVFILYVPAFQFLFSDLDTAVGHYRRYDKSEIVEKLEKSGFYISTVHFADCLGFLVLFLLHIIRIRKSQKMSTPDNLRFYDKFIFPVSSLLDSLGARYLFGKNLVVKAVAR